MRTDRLGDLSPVALFFLRTYVLNRPPLLPDLLPGPAPAIGTPAYFLQQLANALTPASIYALLATGYALIYGITGRINLAFGDFTTVGAFAALNGMVLGALTLAASLPASARVVLLGSIATNKYVDVLAPALGPRLHYPVSFIGRGDMSRGGLLLRSAASGEELEYAPLDEAAARRGPRPAKLPPLASLR